MLKGEEGFCNYLYQGQTLDVETGLAYNRFRYYAPEEGMYVSQDPIRLDGSYYNLYSYAINTNTEIDWYGLDIRENQTAGSDREKLRAEQLQTKYPDSQVQRESYLRDSKGKRIKDDGFTGESRRVDMVVIKDGKIIHIEEVTSKTASKTGQEDKTKRIRGLGPVYIRDRATKKLILLPRRKKISCHRMD